MGTQDNSTGVKEDIEDVSVLWSYFPQDNARPHTARVTINCLTACETLPWPARLPDLSPIKHVWAMIRRRLHLPWNVDDLTRKLVPIWQEIPQKTIRVTIGITFQASITAEVSACSEEGRFGWLRNLHPNSSQRCSMGFRSGLWEGQSSF
ncbi:transposable element Tc1 transposase [Trichonephila clavipes]|nr:transposable element Tc1 transposase [Trichonephila clavipes]